MLANCVKLITFIPSVQDNLSFMEIWHYEQLSGTQLFQILDGVGESHILGANERSATLHGVVLVLVLNDLVIFAEDLVLCEIYTVVHEIVSYFKYLVVKVDVSSNKLVEV